MMNEPIASIMSPVVHAVSKGDSLQSVREIMEKHHVHHVPVMDGTTIVGMLTTYDLLKINRPFAEYDTIKVGDVMTSKLATLAPDDKVGTAAEVILANRFHAIPVVDNLHNLRGLVTSMDLIKYSFKKEYPDSTSIYDKLLGRD
jgi:CBS domain-containing protein